MKILNFKSFKNISVPKIHNHRKLNKLFYYDMEYINGPTLSLYLMSQPISLTNKMINDVLNFIFNCKNESFFKYNKTHFIEKIKDLQKKKSFRSNFYNKIFKSLKRYNWENIDESQSHGDLSLENIIVKNETIKFIDVSENFVDSYKLDISKMLFDLISFWSFRNASLKIDTLKINSLKIYLLDVLTKKLSKNDFDDIKMLIILDFLRVLHYTKKKEEISLLKKKLKKFYDNINNPLRW